MGVVGLQRITHSREGHILGVVGFQRIIHSREGCILGVVGPQRIIHSREGHILGVVGLLHPIPRCSLLPTSPHPQDVPVGWSTRYTSRSFLLDSKVEG